MHYRLLIVALIALVNGCTTLNQDECRTANWESLGYEHGVNGKTYSDGINMVNACKDFNITPNIEQFKTYYEQGLAVYCQPENGFTLAMQGRPYNGICNSREFRTAWEDGHDRYQLQQRKIEIDDRIKELKQLYLENRQQLQSNNLTSSQRKELNSEQRYLENELRDLRREKSVLPIFNKHSTIEVTFP